MRDPLWIRALEYPVRAIVWALWQIADAICASGSAIEKAGWKVNEAGHAVSTWFCHRAEAAQSRRRARAS